VCVAFTILLLLLARHRKMLTQKERAKLHQSRSAQPVVDTKTATGALSGVSQQWSSPRCQALASKCLKQGLGLEGPGLSLGLEGPGLGLGLEGPDLGFESCIYNVFGITLVQTEGPTTTAKVKT